MTAPLVPIAGVFATGVWLGLAAPAPLWLLVASGLLAALLVTAYWRNRLAAAGTTVLLLVGLAGWARVALPDPAPATSGLRAGRLTLEGLVTADPRTDGPRTRLPLVLRSVSDAHGSGPATGRLTVHVYGPRPSVRPGDRIRLTVELREARPYRNPGITNARSLAMRRRPHLFAVGRADAVERLPATRVPWWLAVRVWVHALVQRHLPPVSGALFEGLLIGERRQLPPTLAADFRAAGVFHLLAISGFNVGVVAAAVFLTLRLAQLPRRAAAALALGALAGFATIVGDQPSVLRATLMAGLVLAGLLLGRETHIWNSLAAALLALLVWEPGALANPGFQLSFAATAGILHLSPAIRRALEPHTPRLFASTVAVSAGAQLAVTPLMLLHWNQVSLIGVAANLVVVPLAAAITVLGLVAVLLGAVSDALSHLIFQSLWLLLVALRLVVRGFASLPYAMIHAPSPSPLALGAGCVALLLAPTVRGRRGRVAVFALTAFAGLATAAGFLPDRRLHILVLDVGQGDAILVRGPDGQALLVDTGGGGPGRADRGERVVLPTLRRTGIRRLAALAVTHEDPDHAGGLMSVLAGIPVDEVWVPAGADRDAWLRPVAAAGVRQRVLRRGDRIWLGPLLVRALHPARTDRAWTPARRRDDNHGSLVLRVEWGLAAVLLTGDAEAPAEHEMRRADMPLRTPILKVGHHGSRHASSAAFLTDVAPRLALIPVGGRNPFGHPNPATLARLAAGGAAVYRTDLDGAIEITSDGAQLWIRRWAYPALSREFLLRGAP